MPNKIIFVIRFAVCLLMFVFAANCQKTIVEKTSAQSVNVGKPSEKADTVSRRNATFYFPTVYWAVSIPVAVTDWNAVFGGTVLRTKKEKQKGMGEFGRKYVSGEIKVDKVFLGLPDNSKLSTNGIISAEGFENLKKGDKVIVFVNGFYEREFVLQKIEGTNSALGFKIKDWNEPIVSVLEKAAPCSKIKDTWVEGHPADFRTKMYDCRAERDQIILENAEIWKRYDPHGFDQLLERQEILKEIENQDSTENQ